MSWRSWESYESWRALGQAVSLLVLVSVVLVFATCGCGWVEGHYKYKKEVTDTETVDLAGIDMVKIRLGSGDVIVVSEATDEAVFDIRKTYRTTDKDYLDELEEEGEVTFRRDGSTLIVERESARQTGLDVFRKGYVSIDITATLPAELDLNINTGSGDIDLDDRAGQVWIRSGSGDVTVDGASQGLDAHTGSGDLRIGSVEGGVTFATGSGDIWADRVEGESDFSTGSGDIEIGEITGDFGASTGSGDVDVGGSAGTAYVKTGSGDVTFGDHRGSAEVLTSSGEIEFYAEAGEGEVSLKSSSGDVDVVVYDGDSIELDISTSGGTISTKVPIVVEEASRRRLRGMAGDGKWKLTISTSTGDVSVRRGSI